MRYDVSDVKMIVLLGHKYSSLTQVSSHARKFTCAEVSNVDGFGIVFTSSVACKRIVIVCRRNILQLTLFFFFKKKFTVHVKSMPAIICLKIVFMTSRKIPSPSRFRVNSFGSFTESWERHSLFAVLVWWDGFLSFLIPTLRTIAFWFWWLRHGLNVSLDKFSWTFEYQYPTVFMSFILFCGAQVCMIIFWNVVVVYAEDFVPSNLDSLWVGQFWDRVNMESYPFFFAFFAGVWATW